MKNKEQEVDQFFKENYRRQGDVSLYPLKESLDHLDWKPVEEFILAYGEVSGHHHTAYAPPEGLLAIAELNGKRYLRVRGNATEMYHDKVNAKKQRAEHHMLKINPGIDYEIRHEEAYNPWTKMLTRAVD